jgi:hypothetical protein
VLVLVIQDTCCHCLEGRAQFYPRGTLPTLVIGSDFLPLLSDRVPVNLHWVVAPNV